MLPASGLITQQNQSDQSAIMIKDGPRVVLLSIHFGWSDFVALPAFLAIFAWYASLGAHIGADAFWAFVEGAGGDCAAGYHVHQNGP